MSRNAPDYELVVGKSETIPDQALTVRDIITRFTRGQISIPPIEQGDADDIESSVSYGDLVDAQSDFEQGVRAFQSLKNGQENKDTPKQDTSLADMPTEQGS